MECLIEQTAAKLGVNRHDVFRLAAEAWHYPVCADDAFHLWYHEGYILCWVTRYCFKVMGYSPDKLKAYSSFKRKGGH